MTALRSGKGRRMEKRAAGRAMSRFFWIKWSVLKSNGSSTPAICFCLNKFRFFTNAMNFQLIGHRLGRARGWHRPEAPPVEPMGCAPRAGGVREPQGPPQHQREDGGPHDISEKAGAPAASARRRGALPQQPAEGASRGAVVWVWALGPEPPDGSPLCRLWAWGEKPPLPLTGPHGALVRVGSPTRSAVPPELPSLRRHGF